MTEIAVSKEKLIDIRTDLLFKTNRQGDLLQINDTVRNEQDQAPLLYVCVAESGFILKKRSDVADEWISRIKPFIAQAFTNIHFNSSAIENVIRPFSLSLGDNLTVNCCLAFYIPKIISDPTDVIEISEANKMCLKENFPYTYLNLTDRIPCSAVLVDQEAVAVCRTVRRHPFALECGVDTIAGFQGKGFGTQVVKAWANMVWAMHRVPCYSVDISNISSLAITSKTGMIQYAVDISVTQAK